MTGGTGKLPIGLHLHTPHVLFYSTILVERLVLALITTCLGGVHTEFFVSEWDGPATALVLSEDT